MRPNCLQAPYNANTGLALVYIMDAQERLSVTLRRLQASSDKELLPTGGGYPGTLTPNRLLEREAGKKRGTLPPPRFLLFNPHCACRHRWRGCSIWGRGYRKGAASVYNVKGPLKGCAMAKPGSKYYPLFEFLQAADRERVLLTFSEVERILGTSLPASARMDRAFWSNRGSGALQAEAWMKSGYLVQEVDLVQGRVVFRRAILRYTIRRDGEDIYWDGSMVRALRARLGMNQADLARLLGVRQQTVSEWETGAYLPTRARSKHLTMVAERAGFSFGGGVQEISLTAEEGLDNDHDTV